MKNKTNGSKKSYFEGGGSFACQTVVICVSKNK